MNIWEATTEAGEGFFQVIRMWPQSLNVHRFQIGKGNVVTKHFYAGLATKPGRGGFRSGHCKPGNKGGFPTLSHIMLYQVFRKA